METTLFLDKVGDAGVIGIFIMVAAGLIVSYWTFAISIDKIFGVLVLSTALVGSQSTLLDASGSLFRWLCLFILLFLGVVSIDSKRKIGRGIWFLWFYVFLGIIYLSRSNDLAWQVQRTGLLAVTMLGIPLSVGAYIRDEVRLERTLSYISYVAILYSFASILFLPSQLDESARFSAFITGKAHFSLVLGTLLPFILWKFSITNDKRFKFIYGSAFLAALITLTFGAQRTGLIAGLLSILPMIFLMLQWAKHRKRVVVLIIGAVLLGGVIVYQSSSQRNEYLITRYTNEGLNDRDVIWQIALLEIERNDFQGSGIGAAEYIIRGSFHNGYLEVLYNTGIVGLFFYSMALIYILFSTVRLLRSAERENIRLRITLALFLGSVVGFIAMNVAESVGASASHISLLIFIFNVTIVENMKWNWQDSKPTAKARALGKVSYKPELIRGLK